MRLLTILANLLLATPPLLQEQAPEQAEATLAPQVRTMPSARAKRAVPLRSSPALFGWVSVGTTPRLVLFRWEKPAPATYGYIEQQERTSFWPTEVTRIGESHILVAGRTADEKTILQLWELGTSLELRDQSKQARRTGPPPDPRHVPILQKTTLYEERTPGRDLVRTMWPNRGRDWSFFVQFHDSGDLYEAHVHTPARLTLDRVFSAAPSAEAATEPALAHVGGDRWDAHHKEHGYVYFLLTPGGMCSPPEAMVVFIDHDRDGKLDRARLLEAEDWGSMGFGRSSNYHPDP